MKQFTSKAPGNTDQTLRPKLGYLHTDSPFKTGTELVDITNPVEFKVTRDAARKE
jgi:hypothetical protein